MENPPFVIHKFGYLRSSQIVKNGLTNPKGYCFKQSATKDRFGGRKLVWI